MTRQSESDRRKAVCVECGRFMPIKAKNMCQNCWHKFKRHNDINFLLRTRHSEIKQRCTNPKNQSADVYYGKKFCTLDEFLNKFKDDANLKFLMQQWTNSNYLPKFAPSIDRIDNSGDYTIENLQFITHSDNCMKDKHYPRIKAWDKLGVYVGEFIGQQDAAKQLGLQQANIWKVLNKKRKHTCGYYFEYI